MLFYFIRRILLIFPTFVGITVLVFIVTRFVPGGPVDQYIQSRSIATSGEEGSGSRDSKGGEQPLSVEQIHQLKKLYGFDKPPFIAYFTWLGKILRFDFGRSTRYFDPVIQMIGKRIPISLYFGLINIFFAYLISIPLGIYKAYRHRGIVDNLSSILIFIGYALPAFVVGVILIGIFSYQLDWFALGDFVSQDFNQLPFWGKMKDLIRHTTLPIICYLMGSFAVLTLSMKNNLMENMAADYIRTAVAKGRTFGQSMWLHAFRNSIIPIVGSLGGIITVFLSGSFLIEKIFNLNGMGYLGFKSLTERDYPVVMGILTLSAMASLIANIISDFAVALVDPRIRYT